MHESKRGDFVFYLWLVTHAPGDCSTLPGSMRVLGSLDLRTQRMNGGRPHPLPLPCNQTCLVKVPPGCTTRVLVVGSGGNNPLCPTKSLLETQSRGYCGKRRKGCRFLSPGGKDLAIMRSIVAVIDTGYAISVSRPTLSPL